MARNQYLSWSDVPALINLEEASVLLGLNSESVRKYCITGEIPAVQIGKQWRIDKHKLMKKFGYA
jgi:excisionase family DNA binding protein